MESFFNKLTGKIQLELQNVDIEGCDISIEETIVMLKFLHNCLSDLREHFLSFKGINTEQEVVFFKTMKPEILGLLLYFNKIHNIELKRPTGSNETQRLYYEKELESLTFFFERNLDFYQYYRAKSTYLDEFYFVRGKANYQLCADSSHYILDPLFSTGYDYKVAKIHCNEMLRIYLNKKIQSLDKQLVIRRNRTSLPANTNKWTAPKAAAIELCYSLHCSGAINNGNADIKEIMSLFEACFGIDLGDYYRTYIAIRGRKKDRTPFLNKLIESLIRRMEKDDSE